MNEIICPHCKKAFKIDEVGYADILNQVKNHEFDSELHERLAVAEKDKENAVKLAEEQTKNAGQADAAKKDTEIARLQAKIESTQIETKLAVTQAVNTVEKQRDELAGKLEVKDHEQRSVVSSLNEKHQSELKAKDEMIAQYKDMKLKLSTKMLGETLEQHCEVEFNKLRATAFQNAYFEKDNDAATGSKGDYIYRESD